MIQPIENMLNLEDIFGFKNATFLKDLTDL
jgi:hypothetical protein